MSQPFTKLPFYFDVSKLFKDLKCVKADEWKQHPNTQAYEGEWSVSSLTSTNGETTQIVVSENQEYYETPLMKRMEYIQDILAEFKTDVEAVRFMKLGARSTIKTHSDKGACFEDGSVRIHIPITTSENVSFIIDGNSYPMEPGNCYYINADLPHSVINGGDTDRVHLLIDCHINEWLQDIFLQQGFKFPIYKYGSKSITDENVTDIIHSLEALGTQTALEMAQELLMKQAGDVRG